jgi:hypothetical protein
VVGRLDAQRLAEVVASRIEEGRDPARSLCLACAEVLDVTGVALVVRSGRGSLVCVGVSDLATEAVQQLEFTLGEGPCVAAFQSGMSAFDPDLADDDFLRWPEFRRAALAAGVRAAFGFPLFVEQTCIGALNLYHDRSGVLTADQLADALVVAQSASRTLLAWQAGAPPDAVAWQLEEVPSHRVRVHQATGRIAVQAGLTVADALVLMRAYAFSQDRPISDVAADVAAGYLRFD